MPKAKKPAGERSSPARTRRTQKKDWQQAFLKRLAVDGNVSASAAAAGIGRTTAYARYRDEAPFKAAWDDAIETALDALEAELQRRGVKGWLEPVFYQGAVVGTIRKFSDTCLIAKLNARGKPRGYGRQDVKLAGDPDAPLHQTVIVTDRARRFAETPTNGRRNGHAIPEEAT